MCVGSLFVPEAYITATRQYVAQANSWSLEELCLEVNVTTAQGASLDACSFGIKGQTSLLLLTLAPKNKKRANVQKMRTIEICRFTTNFRFYDFYLSCSAGAHVESRHCSSRSETARSNLCQQQAVSVHHHLHRAASHSAPLDQAKRHREETHGKGSALPKQAR